MSLLEVEIKYRVEGFAEYESRLATLGAVPIDDRTDDDHYFNGPDRNFAQTDEAFRLRRIGSANFLTYKGPRLEADTKTRTEIEVPVADGPNAAEDLLRMLECLGYQPVAVVRKHRRIFRLSRGGFDVDVSLDDVERVGTFAEVEIMAEPEAFAEAKTVVLQVASELGFQHQEKRSYLGMLLLGSEAGK